MWKTYNLKWTNPRFLPSRDFRWMIDKNGKIVTVKARSLNEAENKACKMYFSTGVAIQAEEI